MAGKAVAHWQLFAHGPHRQSAATVTVSGKRVKRKAFPAAGRLILPITPPLRGSRQDEGASPKSRRWGEQRKSLLRPAAQKNRKGRLPPTAAAGAWRLGCRDSPSRGE